VIASSVLMIVFAEEIGLDREHAIGSKARWSSQVSVGTRQRSVRWITSVGLSFRNCATRSGEFFGWNEIDLV